MCILLYGSKESNISDSPKRYEISAIPTDEEDELVFSNAGSASNALISGEISFSDMNLVCRAVAVLNNGVSTWTEEEPLQSSIRRANVLIVAEGAQLLISRTLHIAKLSNAELRSNNYPYINNEVPFEHDAALVVMNEHTYVCLVGIAVETDISESPAIFLSDGAFLKAHSSIIQTYHTNSPCLICHSGSHFSSSSCIFSSKQYNSPLLVCAGEGKISQSSGDAKQSHMLENVGTNVNKNTLSLSDSTFQGSYGINTTTNDNQNRLCSFLLYSPSSKECASFTAIRCRFDITPPLKSVKNDAGLFFITNIQSTMTLTDTSCTYESEYTFMNITGSSFGEPESNGGNIICNFQNLKRTNSVIGMDSISTITGDNDITKTFLLGTSIKLDSYFTDVICYSSGTYSFSGQLLHSLIKKADNDDDCVTSFNLDGICISSPTAVRIVSGEMVLNLGEETTNTIASTENGIIISAQCLIVNASQDALVVDGELVIQAGKILAIGGRLGLLLSKELLVEDGLLYSINCGNYPEDLNSERIILTGGQYLHLSYGPSTKLPLVESNMNTYSELVFSFDSLQSEDDLYVLLDSDETPIIAFHSLARFRSADFHLSQLKPGSHSLYSSGELTTFGEQITDRSLLYTIEPSSLYSKGIKCGDAFIVDSACSSETQTSLITGATGLLFSDKNNNTIVHLSWRSLTNPEIHLLFFRIVFHGRTLAYLNPTLFFYVLSDNALTKEETTFTVDAIDNTYCIRHSVTVATISTGLPIIIINTVDSTPIIDKETKINMSMEIIDPANDANNFHTTDTNATIKGRGNSSWKLPKQGYNIAFKAKRSPLGLKAHKKWSLIANHIDYSLVRNSYASYLGQTLFNTVWCPSYVFIDLILNNDYIGTYVLVESIRIDNNRVNIQDISELKEDLNNDEVIDIKDGVFILEIDLRKDSDCCFMSTQEVPIWLKRPDETSSEINDYVQQFVQKVEDVIYSVKFDDNDEGYRKYFNLNSLADYSIVNDFMRNIDGNFHTSVFHFYNPKDEHLYMGPLWDFDRSCGSVSYYDAANTEGFWICTVNPEEKANWYTQFFKDSVFISALKERWTSKREQLYSSIATIPKQYAEYIQQSAKLNFQRWSLKIDFNAQLRILETWLTERYKWMDDAIQILSRIDHIRIHR